MPPAWHFEPSLSLKQAAYLKHLWGGAINRAHLVWSTSDSPGLHRVLSCRKTCLVNNVYVCRWDSLLFTHICTFTAVDWGPAPFDLCRQKDMKLEQSGSASIRSSLLLNIFLCFPFAASDNSQRFQETCFAFALTPQQVQQISSSM